MKISFRHGWAMLSAAVLSLTALPLSAVSSINTISAAAAAAPVVENLDRGIVAIKSGNAFCSGAFSGGFLRATRPEQNFGSIEMTNC